MTVCFVRRSLALPTGAMRRLGEGVTVCGGATVKSGDRQPARPAGLAGPAGQYREREWENGAMGDKIQNSRFKIHDSRFRIQKTAGLYYRFISLSESLSA